MQMYLALDAIGFMILGWPDPKPWGPSHFTEWDVNFFVEKWLFSGVISPSTNSSSSRTMKHMKVGEGAFYVHVH